MPEGYATLIKTERLRKPVRRHPAKKCGDQILRRKNTMAKYECPCGYVYDPEVGDPDNGIAPGTAFEDIPEDWVCPICGLGKDAFTEA